MSYFFLSFFVIDTGHSKKRGDAYSATGKSEFKYNQRFVKELSLALKKEHINFQLVNSNLSLRERVNFINKNKFDLFLSIHHDSVKEKYLSYIKINKRKQHYSNVFSGHSIFVSSKNKKYKDRISFGSKIGSYLKSNGLTHTTHHKEQIKGENRPYVNKSIEF